MVPSTLDMESSTLDKKIDSTDCGPVPLVCWNERGI